MQFPDNEQFMKLLRSAGFKDVSQRRLTGGIASIYTGYKSMKQ
jgi:ubiquinone/menaquinone biosynthesis C-methylase UbiE